MNEVRFVPASPKTGTRKRQAAPYVSTIRLNIYMQPLFSSRSTGNKCAGDIYTLDSIFTISISISYPKSCTTSDRRNKYNAEVQFSIQSLYREFTLTLKFKDGRRMTLQLIFCSFILRSRGEHLFISRPSHALGAVLLGLIAFLSNGENSEPVGSLSL